MGNAHSVSMQKKRRMDLWQTFDFLQKGRIVFLQRIITIDETLVCDFLPELKSQREIWKGKNSSRPQKSRHQASKEKQMMIMAYNCTGVIVTYTVPYGHTVDQHVCVHFLHKILRPKVQQMHSQILSRVIIFYDNARPHIVSFYYYSFSGVRLGSAWSSTVQSSFLLPTPHYNLFPKFKEPLQREDLL